VILLILGFIKAFPAKTLFREKDRSRKEYPLFTKFSCNKTLNELCSKS